MGNYKYSMDYISDKDVYKAVMFARSMRKQGKRVEIAISIASDYYGVRVSDVAHYMGQLGGRTAARNRRY